MELGEEVRKIVEEWHDRAKQSELGQVLEKIVNVVKKLGFDDVKVYPEDGTLVGYCFLDEYTHDNILWRIKDILDFARIKRGCVEILVFLTPKEKQGEKITIFGKELIKETVNDAAGPIENYYLLLKKVNDIYVYLLIKNFLEKPDLD
jgi:hypothetical protein